MQIKGKYRDIMYKQGQVILDSGWRSNRIVPEFGNLLAALMKKDVSGGIEYIAVGYGSHNDHTVFQRNVQTYFTDWWPKTKKDPQLIGGQDQLGNPYWVWAKEIKKQEIDYLYENGKPVENKLQIKITFEKDEPSTEPLAFKEFALLWINRNPDGTINMTAHTPPIYLINYVDHGLITKDDTMDFYTRTIQLTFPVTDATHG